MNKSEFLRIIRDSLKTYPPQISEDILNKYETSFKSGYNTGKNDEDIISELGDPYELAQKYDTSYKNSSNHASPNFTGFNTSDSNIKLIIVILVAIFFSPIILGIGAALLGLFASFIALLTTLVVTTITSITSIVTGTTSVNILGISTLNMPMSAQVLFCIGNISSIILLLILIFFAFRALAYLGKLIPTYLKKL